MTAPRKKISAPVQAALWALSNGRCYFPDCPAPVVLQVKLGVYRKNAQIAHIYGVALGAPRYKPLPAPERDSFSNLILLCYPHHCEIDDEVSGELLYPAEVLHGWKSAREGKEESVLAGLGAINEEALTALLMEAFTPPINRLQSIADQLEETGAVSKETVQELRAVARVLGDAPGPDLRTARLLAEAAEVFGSRSFQVAASTLGDVAQVMHPNRLAAAAEGLQAAARQVDSAAQRARQML
jgi:hypothetical protein